MSMFQTGIKLVLKLSGFKFAAIRNALLCLSKLPVCLSVMVIADGWMLIIHSCFLFINLLGNVAFANSWTMIILPLHTAVFHQSLKKNIHLQIQNGIL